MDIGRDGSMACIALHSFASIKSTAYHSTETVHSRQHEIRFAAFRTSHHEEPHNIETKNRLTQEVSNHA